MAFHPLPMSTVTLRLMSSADLLRVHWFATMSLIETVLVSISTLRTPFLTDLHSALDQSFLDAAVQPIPYPPKPTHQIHLSKI